MSETRAQRMGHAPLRHRRNYWADRAAVTSATLLILGTVLVLVNHFAIGLTLILLGFASHVAFLILWARRL